MHIHDSTALTDHQHSPLAPIQNLGLDMMPGPQASNIGVTPPSAYRHLRRPTSSLGHSIAPLPRAVVKIDEPALLGDVIGHALERILDRGKGGDHRGG